MKREITRVSDVDSVMSDLGFDFAHLKYSKLTRGYVRVYTRSDGPQTAIISLGAIQNMTLEQVKENVEKALEAANGRD